MKSETTADVLEGWGKEKVKLVVCVWAMGHHGKTYEEVHVHRIGQPTYSTELNLTERVFEHSRVQIEARTYRALGTKKSAVEAEVGVRV